MSPEISERSFEEAIECGLLRDGPDACAGEAHSVRETPPPYADMLPGGYRKRRPEDYDRTLCLVSGDVLDFVAATQIKEWKTVCVVSCQRSPGDLFVRQGSTTDKLPPDSALQYIATRFNSLSPAVG